MTVYDLNSMESTKSGKYGSMGRYLFLLALFLCLAIAGVGLGLGLYINAVSKDIRSECPGTTPVAVTAPPQTTTVKPTTSSQSSASIEGHYRFGAVASDAGECSQIGNEILIRRGGSAVDAAIAALLCQCVHNMHSCGIGGGFFMTIYNKTTNQAHAIIAREMAPAAADENMFIPTDVSSVEGGMSIGVPGEIAGLWEAYKLGGKLPWKDLFEPTIKLCENGLVLQEALDKAIQTTADRGFLSRNENLRKQLTDPITTKLYRAGDTMKWPKLAATLRKIADEGPNAFYNGSLTADIVADIKEAGGIITEEDLHNYVAKVKQPLVIQLKDNSSVYAPPPPSSGAVLQFILNIADEFGFNEDSMSTMDNKILTWHRIIEAFKFAYAKRSSLGDGDGEDEAFRKQLDSLIQNMTSPEFAIETRNKIDDSQTFDTMYYGPTFYDQVKTSTAHLSLLAPSGDAVSVTSTINLYFGSKVLGSRTGILFNDEMDDFSTPNTTNSFGVPSSAANFIKPGKRPLSSMCPGIAVGSDGNVRLVVGSSGGTKITTSTALVAMETLWFKMGVKEAVDHRRLHHQLLPKEIQAEEGFPEEILAGLRAKKHEITRFATGGSVIQAILVNSDKNITANCDFRKGGFPDGV